MSRRKPGGSPEGKSGVLPYRLRELGRAPAPDVHPSAHVETAGKAGFVPFLQSLGVVTAATLREGAEALLHEARKKAVDIEQEAYRLGFSQGERAGIQLAQEKLTPLLEGFVRVMKELEGLRERIYRDAERELIELACAVAEKVVQREVEINAEVILRRVQSVLSDLADRQELRVRLNPADAAFLRQYRGDLVRSVESLHQVGIEEDPSVSRGGYIVETPNGNLDGRLEVQIARIREEFLAQCALGAPKGGGRDGAAG